MIKIHPSPFLTPFLNRSGVRPFQRLIRENRPCLRVLQTFLCIAWGITVLGQEEKDPFLDEINGTVTATNNGISLIPSFSLDDPALMFDFEFVKGRFSIEPDLRFAMEGKPWTFLFWFRYDVVDKEKFTLRAGAHPAMNFRTVSVIRDARPEDIIETRRYVAAELVPSYEISDKVDFGLYYLAGHGFDEGVKNTHFLAVNATFSDLVLYRDYSLEVSPQCYYLKTDDLHGFYAVSFLSLEKEDFPLSIGATLNKALHTEIAPEKDFIWNISLVYDFTHQFERRIVSSSLP